MNEKGVDKKRRNFLKIMLLGGGGFVAVKLFDPISKFLNGPSIETDFQNFKTVENKKGLTIYDKSGEEIFQIDKGE